MIMCSLPKLALSRFWPAYRPAILGIVVECFIYIHILFWRIVAEYFMLFISFAPVFHNPSLVCSSDGHLVPVYLLSCYSPMAFTC